MIVVDTGPIVALFDKEDDNYRICREVFKEIRQTLITTWPVVTEAFHLLGFSTTVQDDLWEFIERGTVTIYDLDKALRRTCRDMMKQYRDIPMDLADASIVALSEKENIRTIFTLDKDFKVYRTKDKKHFKLLPREF